MIEVGFATAASNSLESEGGVELALMFGYLAVVKILILPVVLCCVMIMHGSCHVASDGYGFTDRMHSGVTSTYNTDVKHNVILLSSLTRPFLNELHTTVCSGYNLAWTSAKSSQVTPLCVAISPDTVVPAYMQR